MTVSSPSTMSPTPWETTPTPIKVWMWLGGRKMVGFLLILLASSLLLSLQRLTGEQWISINSATFLVLAGVNGIQKVAGEWSKTRTSQLRGSSHTTPPSSPAPTAELIEDEGEPGSFTPEYQDSP